MEDTTTAQSKIELELASLTSNAIADDSERNPKWWMYFFAGELSGMIGAFLCHPFDTAKTRLQMLNQTHAQSTFSLMKQTVVKHGFGSLYRGVLYPFFGFGVLFSMSFGINGIFRNYFIQQNIANNMQHPTDLSIMQLAIGGVFAGAGSSIMRTPIERVKTWSQIHHISTLQSTKVLLSRYGLLKGLWFGIVPTMTREVPQFAVYYPIYEMSCALLCRASHSQHNVSYDKSQISNSIIFVSGASAGVGCWVLTYPIDVMKTRIQAEPPGKYLNMLDCCKDIYSRGGVKMFWVGLAPTIYRAALLHSAIFLVYERTLTSVQNYASKD